ncbi:MAG: periplasmic heavy metal sensor [Thermodesulfobacteriota bacterium]
MKRNLILTAVLGVLMTGAVAAFAMPHGGGPFGIEKLKAFSQLSPDKQALVVNTFESVKQENKGLRDQIKAAHENMKKILTAPTFDANAFKENANKLQSLMQQGFTAYTNAIAQLAPKLTQQERQVLAELGPGGHGKP